MSNNNSSNQDYHLIKLIVDNWKGISIVCGIAGAIFWSGFKLGQYITKNDCDKANYDLVIKYQAQMQDLKSQYQDEELKKTKSSVEEIKKAMDKLQKK